MNWFRYYILQQRYTIQDLKNPKSILSEKDRSMVKILIIDNEEFTKENSLRRLGYNIQKYDDLESLEAAQAFHIIISDVSGVGVKLGSPQEGAFLLNQLRKKYPMKEFAVYSGKLYNTEMTELIQGMNIIQKDQTCDDWSEDIDTLIRKVTNPKQIWQRIAKTMIENDVPTSVLKKMEHEYAEVILDNNGDFSKFPSDNCIKKVDSNITGIIHSLVAGIVLLPFSATA